MLERACQKQNMRKRFIPKEGMPHAHKACQKKRKDVYPKKGMTHTHKVCQKKEK